MVLHGLHQQLLAFQIIGEHLVVFQICKELHSKKLHQRECDCVDTNGAALSHIMENQWIWWAYNRLWEILHNLKNDIYTTLLHLRAQSN